MSNKPPPRRSSPPSDTDPSGSPNAPAAGVSEGTAGNRDHITRIRTAVSLIDGHPETPTTARAVISGYYRSISRKLNDLGFPRSLRRHPANAEHSFEGGNKFLVLYYHIGNACEAIYVAHELDGKLRLVPESEVKAYDAAKEKVVAAIEVLERRTQLLERLAMRAWHDWFMHGDDRTGYYLDISQARANRPTSVRNNPIFDEAGKKRHAQLPDKQAPLGE